MIDDITYEQTKRRNEKVARPQRLCADIVEHILERGAAGELEDIKKALKNYSGGSIFPFEYDVVRKWQDIRYKDEVIDLPMLLADFEALRANPIFKWPFEPGDKVIRVGNTAKGHAIAEVDFCYEGQSWDGWNCYVRLVGEPDSGYGYEGLMKVSFYAAMVEARAGDGVLRVLRSSEASEPFWVRQTYSGEVPAEAAHITDATMTELIEAYGAFVIEGSGPQRRAILNENCNLLKKCGLRLDALARAELVVRRCIQREPDFRRALRAEPDIDIKGFAAIIVRDLGLKD